MSKQTAAEKFDKIPPWCKIEESRSSYAVVSVGGTEGVFVATVNGAWVASPIYHAPKVCARRIARLTRPLDSWEPAPDYPLPVDTWGVSVCDGRFGIADRRSFAQPAQLFDTRRAAIVWAWTEAPAPEERKPITEADVKVGQVWSGADHTRTVLAIDHNDDVRTVCSCGRNDVESVAQFVRWINRTPPSVLITPGTVATDGPDDRGTRTLAEMDDAMNDRIVEFHQLGDRVAKVEGVLARICPEADSQVDGKGRTLVQIDRETDAEIKRLWKELADVSAAVGGLKGTVQGMYDRVDLHGHKISGLDSLIAAQVPAVKLNARSDAASTVEAMTEAAAVNQCCVCQLTGPTYQSPDGMHGWFCKAHALSGYEIREAIPSAYRIPGTTLAGCVRNLASAHEKALKYQRELERKLGDANTAAVAAEGRARSVLNVVCASCREAVKAALGKGELPGCKL